MSAEQQPESSASPYGPAKVEPNDLERAFGEQPSQADKSNDAFHTTGAPAAPVDYPEWVTRGRSILRWSSIATGAVSLLVLVVTMVLAATGNNVLSSVQTEIATNALWVATIASPVLFVIAMNLLIWRALLRPLARKPRAEKVILVTLTVVGLAVASFVAVVLLLLGGFFLLAVFA